MAPHRLLAAAALAVALVLPDTAMAKPSKPLRAAAAVAQEHWGAVPCNGQVKLLAQQRPAAGVADADAWVTFDSPLGANNLAAPARSYTNCTIAFSATGPWPTAASMRSDWNMFCTTMTHELGHLLGHVHDSTSGSVMAPVFTDRSSVTAKCRAARPARTARNRR